MSNVLGLPWKNVEHLSKSTSKDKGISRALRQTAEEDGLSVCIYSPVKVSRQYIDDAQKVQPLSLPESLKSASMETLRSDVVSGLLRQSSNPGMFVIQSGLLWFLEQQF